MIICIKSLPFCSGVTTITRGCDINGGYNSTCKEMSLMGLEVTTCFCYTDSCNHGDILGMSMMMMTFMVAFLQININLIV